MSSIFRNLLVSLGYIVQYSRVITAQALISIGLMWIGAKYFGMAGIAAAPIVAVGATAIWVGPLFVLRHLRATAADCWAILGEVGMSIGCGLLTVVVISQLPRWSGWTGFIGRAVLDAAVYAALLAAASPRFRRVLRRMAKEGIYRMVFAR
jgi:hypothetical protein